MKFKYLFIAVAAIMLMASLKTQDEKFYYSFDKKVPLVSNSNKLFVNYYLDTDIVKKETFIKESIPDAEIRWHNPFLLEIECKSEKYTKEIRAKLMLKDDVRYCTQAYIYDGHDIGVADEILVRFLPNVQSGEQKKVHEKFKTKVVEKNEIFQLLVIPKGSDALEIANQYYETGLFEFAYPSFISYPIFHQVIPNDTYFGNQITCHNIGQVFNDGHSGTADADIDAPDAWEISKGCGDVIIAVIDQGVTSNHPDLPNTRQIRLNGSNFGDGNANDPSPTGDGNHGNSCAGVIAATMNNNQGIAGIAPYCRIMPIRIDNATGADVANAITFAVNNGADILSNSWGLAIPEPAVVTAIRNAVNNNRVVIFAAGNTANHASNNNGSVTYPANQDISPMLVVGASDRNDSQANYSPTSSLIDVVAPSHRAYPTGITGETFEMWSIDIPDSAGYNVWHGPTIPPNLGEVLPSTGTNHLAYTGRFGGTSHSCPVVAGVAALMLSVDSSLTPQEVFNILTSTADDVGGYAYSNGRCNEMGYGRVNAFSAVSAVIDQFTITAGPNVVCYSSNPANASQFTASNSPTCSTIDWTTSLNLEVVDGDNTLTPKVNAKYASSQGSGWVQINYLLDGETTPGPRKNTWVGKPQVYSLSNHLVDINTGMPVYDFCYGTHNEVEAVHPAGDAHITAWDWRVTGGTVYPYGSQYKYATIYPNSYSNFMVEIRAINTCGVWTDWARMYTNVVDCGRSLLVFTPNPTTGETTLSIESESEEKTFDDNTEWDMEVYSPGQVLKEKKAKLKGKSTTIQTQSWKDGVYVVRVKYKNEILTGKLVVKE